METREFFEKLITDYRENWIFENNADNNVLSGPLKKISLSGGRVYFDCHYMKNKGFNGKLFDWPIHSFSYDLVDVVAFRLEKGAFLFRHKEYGVFRVRPQ